MYPSYDSSAPYPNYPAQPANTGATLEYSIISSILNPSAPGASASAAPAQNGQNRSQTSASYGSTQPQAGLVAATWPSEPQYSAGGQTSTGNGFGSGANTSPTSYSNTTRPSNTEDMSPPSVTESAAYLRLQNTYGSNQSAPYGQSSTAGASSSGMSYDYQSSQQSQASSSGTLPFTSPNASILSPFQRTRTTPTPSWSASNGISVSDAVTTSNNLNNGNSNSYANGTAAVANLGGQVREASSVYKMVTKKYDYTEGYHFLMKHISCRCVSRFLFFILSFRISDVWRTYSGFEKNDILRIVRALAIFRPSLIALQMPMTEEDEVFIEKCFQRSLVVRTLS